MNKVNVLIEPKALLISKQSWESEEHHWIFRQYLHDIADALEKYEWMDLVWSRERDIELWCNRDSAWIYDNELIQLYNQFINYRLHYYDPSSMECEASAGNVDDLQFKDFLKVVHTLIINDPSAATCFLKSRIDSLVKESNTVDFYCNCHGGKINASVIDNPMELILKLDLIDHFWLTGHVKEDKYQLEQLVNLSIYGHILRYPDKMPKCNFKFTDRFAKKIAEVSDKRHRKAIVSSLVRRLTMSLQEAATDAQLQDEYILGNDCRRFRVTPRPTSTRIHYCYDGADIVFWQYYAEGEHDLGLK